MTPISRVRPAASRPALRRLVGAPVLAMAMVMMMPWLALNALLAGVVLAYKAGMQAMDYAGQVALGR